MLRGLPVIRLVVCIAIQIQLACLMQRVFPPTLHSTSDRPALLVLRLVWREGRVKGHGTHRLRG